MLHILRHLICTQKYIYIIQQYKQHCAMTGNTIEKDFVSDFEMQAMTVPPTRNES